MTTNKLHELTPKLWGWQRPDQRLGPDPPYLVIASLNCMSRGMELDTKDIPDALGRVMIHVHQLPPHATPSMHSKVTFSLVLGGALPWQQGVLHLFMQLSGSLVGAGILAVVFPCELDITGNLGSNVVNPAFGLGRALLVEVVGTFILCKAFSSLPLSGDFVHFLSCGLRCLTRLDREAAALPVKVQAKRLCSRFQ